MFTLPLLQLARQKYFWSPPRLFRIILALASNIRRQLEIFRLLAFPAFQQLVLANPEFPFRYLSRDYLARGLTTGDRASCFMNHYKQLKARLPAILLNKTLQQGMTLYEMEEAGSLFAITLGFSRKEVREGELVLHLAVDGVPVFVLQFTIVPGWAVGSTAADLLLVSRLQGMKGCFAQVRAATKAFREVAPPALLVAALQGFARSFAIEGMAGVCATSQFSFTPDHAVSFKEAYDNFFIELGATRSTAAFFTSPFPIEEKPVDLIRNGHKSRTRKKRAFKLEVSEQVYCRIIENSSEVAEPLGAPARRPRADARLHTRAAA